MRITVMVITFLGFSLLIPVSGLSGSFYLGGGFNHLQIFSDEKSFTDNSSGSNFFFNMGFRLSEHFAIESVYSFTPMDLPSNAPQGDYMGMYQIRSFGVKYDILSRRQHGWTPWVGVYRSSHDLSWNEEADSLFDLFFNGKLFPVATNKGSGTSMAVGLDLRISKPGILQVAYRNHSYKGEFASKILPSGNYDNEIHEITLGYVYFF